MRKIRIRLWIAILCACLLVLALIFSLEDVGFYNKRIMWTEFSLKANRDGVAKFKIITGRYPHSLVELRKYAKQNPESEIMTKHFKEYISDKQGRNEETDVLDGSGGWFYNKKTGEVKVNVIEPVKNYLRLYFGQKRSEIPSHW